MVKKGLLVTCIYQKLNNIHTHTHSLHTVPFVDDCSIEDIYAQDDSAGNYIATVYVFSTCIYVFVKQTYKEHMQIGTIKCT